MPSFSILVPILGLATTGFLAGLLNVFSSSVMRALDAITRAEALAAMKVINRDIMRPVFVVAFLGSAAMAVAAIVLSIGSLSGRGWLLLAGLLHLVGFLVVTATVHLPLNAMFDTLDETATPDLDRWTEGVRRWTRFNHVRSGATVLSAIAYSIHLASTFGS